MLRVGGGARLAACLFLNKVVSEGRYLCLLPANVAYSKAEKPLLLTLFLAILWALCRETRRRVHAISFLKVFVTHLFSLPLHRSNTNVVYYGWGQRLVGQVIIDKVSRFVG